MSEINFGDEVSDKVTGFRGIVTGRASYITGCDQYLVVPKVDEKGTAPEARWIDLDRLTVDQRKAVVLVTRTAPGSDMAAPVK